MPRFEVIEAKRHHCGMMARHLRYEHHIALNKVGCRNIHRELVNRFDESAFRRSWMIDGRLAALGGVTGPLASPIGVVWLAFTEQATRYPIAIVKEAKKQLSYLISTRQEIVTTVLGSDAAGKRLATFCGFHVEDDGQGKRAESHLGRQRLLRYIDGTPDLRIPVGEDYCIGMGFHLDQ